MHSVFGKLCGVKKRVLPRSLLQQLIVASGPGAEEDMTALLELLHSTGHTNLALRDGLNNQWMGKFLYLYE